MSVKVFFAGTDASDSQKLAVRDAVFAPLWMRRIVVQVVMRVSRFAVKVCGDQASIQLHQGVQEGDFYLGFLCCELDVW